MNGRVGPVRAVAELLALELRRALRRFRPVLGVMLGTVVLLCGGALVVGISARSEVVVEVADPGLLDELRELVRAEDLGFPDLVDRAPDDARAVIRPPADPVRRAWTIELRHLSDRERAARVARELQAALRARHALGPTPEPDVPAPTPDRGSATVWRALAILASFALMVLGATGVDAEIQQGQFPSDAALGAPRRALGLAWILRGSSIAAVPFGALVVFGMTLGLERGTGAWVAVCTTSLALMGASLGLSAAGLRDRVSAAIALPAVAFTLLGLMLVPDSALLAVAVLPAVGFVAFASPEVPPALIGLAQGGWAVAGVAVATRVWASPSQGGGWLPTVRSR